jgi:histidyl-tRNA synthetase
MLGGPRAPGIGFAIGQDRLILTLQAQAGPQTLEPGTSNLEPQKLDAYIAPLGPERNPAALTLARELRRAGLSIEVGDGSFRLKKSFEAADRIARHIILLGEDEAQSDILTVKTFATSEQSKVPRAKLAEALRS